MLCWRILRNGIERNDGVVRALLVSAALTTVFGMRSATANQENYLEDLIEGLLNVQVVSSSKRAERLIDAPTSISSLTRDEIRRSGATTLAEALRLIPGMIVSEQTNGYYDVNIRGFNLAPSDLIGHQTASKNILVMIDNRIVYDPVWGYTSWHDIALDIEDIDRIEVVRGPATALYGPNAFTGVIHILTARPSVNDERTFNVRSSFSTGAPNMTKAYASVDFAPELSDWRAMLSVNADFRDRHQETFYSTVNDSYGGIDEIFDTNFVITLGPDFVVADHFSDPARASEHRAANFFWQYDDNLGKQIQIDMGHVEDNLLKVGYLNPATPFNATNSDNDYLNIHYKEDGFYAQFYHSESAAVFIDDVTGLGATKYGVSNSVIRAGYDWLVASDHRLQFEYKYNQNQSTFLSSDLDKTVGPPTVLVSNSFSIREDYRPNEKLRLVAAVSVDDFDLLRTAETAFQFIGTYALRPDHVARIHYSEANRVPFASEILSDDSIDLTGGVTLNIQGTQKLPLAKTSMFELGFRGSLFEKSFYDIELWYQTVDTLTAALLEVNDAGDEGILFTGDLQTELAQTGLTLSFKHIITKNVFVNYSLTWQETTIEDYFADLLRREDFVESGTLLSTPEMYGNFTLNWRFYESFNLNVNGYYMDERVLDAAFFRPDTVEATTILNAKLSYDFLSDWTVYLNGRNLMDSGKREFFFTDDSRRIILFGVDYRPNKG